MCKEYNGYSSYETWCIGLWIDNDESTQSYIIELAEQAEDVYELERNIKDYVDENNPLADGASMYTDLLNSAIENCNFLELAEGYFEEYHKAEDEEENEDE